MNLTIQNFLSLPREQRIKLKIAALNLMMDIAKEEGNNEDILFYTRRLNDMELCKQDENMPLEPENIDDFDGPFYVPPIPATNMEIAQYMLMTVVDKIPLSVLKPAPVPYGHASDVAMEESEKDCLAGYNEDAFNHFSIR